MKHEKTQWHVSIPPGKDVTTRNGTTIENKGDLPVRLIIKEKAKTAATVPEGKDNEIPVHDA